MNRVQGMSITELNSALKDMRTVYEFDDDKTYFASMHNEISLSQTHVEIHTKDEATGIKIVMSKDITPSLYSD